MNKTVACIIIMVCLLGAQACKKGCTDPKAINYTTGVKYDDASCLYCDSSVTLGNSETEDFEDMTQGSPHFEQFVLFINANSKSVVYNGNACQQLGLATQVNPNGCTTGDYYAILSNETSSTMVTSGTLVIETGGGDLDYNVSSVTIAPFGSDTLSVGTSSCSNDIFSINFLNATYQYH